MKMEISVAKETHQFKDSSLGRIPAEWEVESLQLRALIKGGKRLPSGHNYAKGDSHYRYLQTTDFINKQINYNSLHYLNFKTFKILERYEIQNGNVFISIAGVNLGVAGVFRPDIIDRTILTENAAKICTLEEDLPEYIAIQINGPIIQRQILEEKGVGGVPKLALFRIQQLLISWPANNEQTKIVDQINKFEDFLQIQKMELSKLKSIKEALLKELLLGKKRVTALLKEREAVCV